MIEIPLEPYNPHYELQTVLGEKSFTLVLSYNHSLELFILSILDSESQPILEGIPLQADIPLLHQYHSACENLPKGELFFLSDPKYGQLEHLGVYHKLYFMEFANAKL